MAQQVKCVSVVKSNNTKALVSISSSITIAGMLVLPSYSIGCFCSSNLEFVLFVLLHEATSRRSLNVPITIITCEEIKHHSKNRDFLQLLSIHHHPTSGCARNWPSLIIHDTSTSCVMDNVLAPQCIPVKHLPFINTVQFSILSNKGLRKLNISWASAGAHLRQR